MRFAQPWLLGLLVPVLAGLWARLARPAWFEAALIFSTGRQAGRIPLAWPARLLRRSAVLAWGVAAALACLALARPQRVILLGAEPERGIDILLALDTSASMKALDFDPMNRLVAAKKHARAFIAGRRNDRIGIVVFGGYAFLQCPLTLDYAALLEYLDLVEPEMTGEDGTSIGDGIATAVNHLEDSKALSRVVILLTDGRHNTGTVDPLTAAKAAATLGVKVYTVGTGIRGPSVFPMEDPVYGTRWVQIQEDLDETTLQEVAHRTGAQYYRAASVPEMQHIFREIDQLERSKVEAPPAVATRDLYPWFLAPAMLLAAASLGLHRAVFVRLP